MPGRKLYITDTFAIKGSVEASFRGGGDEGGIAIEITN